MNKPAPRIIPILFTLVLAALPLCGQVDTLIQEGRQALVNEDIQTAYSKFKQAADQAPNHDWANAYAGMTALAVRAESPEWQSLAADINLIPVNSSVFYFDYGIVYDMLGDPQVNEAFQVSDAQPFAENTVLPALLEAEMYLSRIQNPNFWLILDTTETKQLTTIQLDYTDILAMRAVNNLAEFAVRYWLGHNTVVSLQDLLTTEDGMLFLDQHPALLDVRASGQLASAKTALQAGINLYQQASPLLVARAGSGQGLFQIDPWDLETEEVFTFAMGQVEQALWAPVEVTQVTRNPNHGEYPEVNLSPLFASTGGLGLVLPDNIANGLWYNSWTDPSWGGILSGMDAYDRDFWLSDAIGEAYWWLFTEPEISTFVSFQYRQYDSGIPVLDPDAYNPVSLDVYLRWEFEYQLQAAADFFRIYFPDTTSYEMGTNSLYESFNTPEELISNYPQGDYRFSWRDSMDTERDSVSLPLRISGISPVELTEDTLARLADVTPYQDLWISWIPAASVGPDDYYGIAFHDTDWEIEEFYDFIPATASGCWIPGEFLLPGKRYELEISLNKDTGLVSSVQGMFVGQRGISVETITSAQAAKAGDMADVRHAIGLADSDRILKVYANPRWISDERAINGDSSFGAGEFAFLGWGDEVTLSMVVKGPGLVNFWWMNQTDPSYETTFGLYLDGELAYSEYDSDPLEIYAPTPWQEDQVFVPAGIHLLEWTYEHDWYEVISPQAFVDAVSFTPLVEHDDYGPWVQSMEMDPNGEVEFYLIGGLNEGDPFGLARDISGDGDYVVGYGQDSSWQLQPVIWTKASGLKILPMDYQGETVYRFVTAEKTSSTGKTVIGRSLNADGFVIPAMWQWEGEESWQVDLTFGDLWVSTDVSTIGRALAFVDDYGPVYGHLALNGWEWETASGNPSYPMVRWNYEYGDWIPEVVGQREDYPDDFTECWPYDISGDGSTIVGWMDDAAFTWTAVDGFEMLPGRDIYISTFARRVSADGSTIIGTVTEEAGVIEEDWIDHPAFWRDGQLTVLPLPEGYVSGGLSSVSGDGSLMTGYLSMPPTEGEEFGESITVVWSEKTGFIPLVDYVEQLTGFTTDWDLGGNISDDGSMFYGGASKPTGEYVGYLLRLPVKDATDLELMKDHPLGEHRGIVWRVDREGNAVADSYGPNDMAPMWWPIGEDVRLYPELPTIVDGYRPPYDGRLQDITPDGKFIAGRAHNDMGQMLAFRENLESGTGPEYIVPPRSSGNFLSAAVAISDDGKRLVGNAGEPEEYTDHSKGIPFAWSESTGFQYIDITTVLPWDILDDALLTEWFIWDGWLYDISADGSQAIGFVELYIWPIGEPSYTFQEIAIRVRWDESGNYSIEKLSDWDFSLSSSADAISANGKFATGQLGDAPAFWDQWGRVHTLPIPTGYIGGDLRCSDASGRTMTGYFYSGGDFDGFIWDRENGLRMANDFLKREMGLRLGAHRVEYFRISDDGQWVHGDVSSRYGDAGFRIRLPGPYSFDAVPDFDGDGADDLVWTRKDGWYSWGQRATNYVDNGAIQNLAWTYIGGNDNWQIVGYADWNGDGKSDLLWRNNDTLAYSAQIVDGWNDGWTAYNLAWTTIGGDAEMRIVGTPDWNGDGKSDLLWKKTSTGEHFAQIVTGFNDGWTAYNLAWVYIGGSHDFVIADTPDWNGDGKSDVLWRQPSTGYQWAQILDGFNDGWTAYNVAWTWIGGNSDYALSGTPDWNGDGKDDLLWIQHSTGYQWAQVVDGFTDGGAVQNVAWVWIGGTADFTVTETPDFNGDNRADLLWTQHSTGYNWAQIVTLQDGGATQNQAWVWVGGNAQWGVY